MHSGGKSITCLMAGPLWNLQVLGRKWKRMKCILFQFFRQPSLTSGFELKQFRVDIWDLLQPNSFVLGLSFLLHTLHGRGLVAAVLLLEGSMHPGVCERCRQQRSPVWAGFPCQGLKRCFFLLCCFVSRAFGTVYKGLDRATGGEVSANTPSTPGSSPGLSPPLGAVAAALGASRAFLPRLLL